MGRKQNALLLSIVFSLSPGRICWVVGIRQRHSGPLLLRDSIHRPEHKNRLRHSARGTRGPTLQPCTQRRTMFTIFAVDTKEAKGKILLSSVWQVCLAVSHCPLHAGPVFLFTCCSSRGWNFTMLCVILRETSFY